MDYAAEQEMELESLEAILGDALEKYEGIVPDGWPVGSIYRVILKPTEEENQAERRVALDFQFAYRQSYPDENPFIRLQSSYGLEDSEVSEVHSLIEIEIENNMGMPMMFNLIETAKEWLRNQANVDVSSLLTEEEKRKLKEDEEEKKILEERAHGIPVTVETFAKWKEGFEAEIKKKPKKAKAAEDPRLSRPTGKQLFLQNPDKFGLEDTMADDECDFDFEEDDDDEDEVVDHILAQNE